MNYLLPGGESAERFDLLLSFTKITSESTVGALRAIYVEGFPQDRAAARFILDKSNLARDIAKLEKVAAKIEAIKQLDYSHIDNKYILRVPVPQQ